MTTVGIIGGSGLYGLEGLKVLREISVETPFGHPSDALVEGTLGGVRTLFLARHGRGHKIQPSDINYRANIWALKAQGAQSVVSVSAVGSLREEIVPGHMVLPNQYVDRTNGRASTFFGDGLVAHVSLADPACPKMLRVLAKSIEESQVPVHQQKTYVCMNGPAFSTRAESNLYRSWGMDIIGMTALPEAKLAREAELHYATIALATDYDCWRVSEDAVTVEDVVAVLRKNTENVKRVLGSAVPALAEIGTGCACAQALDHAILTAPDAIDPGRRESLAPILARLLGSNT